MHDEARGENVIVGANLSLTIMIMGASQLDGPRCVP